MKPPEPRVQKGPNGHHLSRGRKGVAPARPGVAGPVQEASGPAMLRIVRVKGFQRFSVSLPSVLRPTPPANGRGGAARKSRQHRPGTRLTRRGLPRHAYQPVRRRLRPKAFVFPKPAVDHQGTSPRRPFGGVVPEEAPAQSGCGATRLGAPRGRRHRPSRFLQWRNERSLGHPWPGGGSPASPNGGAGRGPGQT
jgi:hypothetical protein